MIGKKPHLHLALAHLTSTIIRPPVTQVGPDGSGGGDGGGGGDLGEPVPPLHTISESVKSTSFGKVEQNFFDFLFRQSRGPSCTRQAFSSHLQSKPSFDSNWQSANGKIPFYI